MDRRPYEIGQRCRTPGRQSNADRSTEGRSPLILKEREDITLAPRAPSLPYEISRKNNADHRPHDDAIVKRRTDAVLVEKKGVGSRAQRCKLTIVGDERAENKAMWRVKGIALLSRSGVRRASSELDGSVSASEQAANQMSPQQGQVLFVIKPKIAKTSHPSPGSLSSAPLT
ncbi:hypothetical protein BV25DRAFT_363542 [Artomyces pyxidatus]|uniref:Uncharacterized protein n=1 Tax=Artomyces pyxidatus TaxID=48021 RepID=A0ACB8T6Q1_9AGAM|nr:hypothetical protein BV25DRAFT_363542 [Artomyces pyxidatus]